MLVPKSLLAVFDKTRSANMIKQPDPSRELVAKAFKAMRRQGLVARQNFLCCSSCAGAQLMAEPRLADKPYCYFHKQDGEVFGRSGTARKLHLRFGVIKDADATDFELKQTTNIIISSLRAQGLTVEWNGDHRECIVVLV